MYTWISYNLCTSLAFKWLCYWSLAVVLALHRLLQHERYVYPPLRLADGDFLGRQKNMKKIFSESLRSISYIFQVSMRCVHIWGSYAPLKILYWDLLRLQNTVSLTCWAHLVAMTLPNSGNVRNQPKKGREIEVIRSSYILPYILYLSDKPSKSPRWSCCC